MNMYFAERQTQLKENEKKNTEENSNRTIRNPEKSIEKLIYVNLKRHTIKLFRVVKRCVPKKKMDFS